MHSVEEIIHAIQELPHQDYTVLKDWLLENDWQQWDEKIEADSRSGKLDFLIEEAKIQKKTSKLIDL